MDEPKKYFKKTKGFYPAPLEALKLLHKTYSWPVKKALEEEKKVFCQLATTEISKNLVQLFFLTEQIKKEKGLSTSASVKPDKAPPIKNVGVIGAGVMGRGIAYVSACQNLNIRLQDTYANTLVKSKKEIQSLFNKQIKRKKLTPFEVKNKQSRIQYSHHLNGFSNMDMVIEAVVEDLSIKKKVIQDTAKQLNDSCIFATNTSSLSVTEMAKSHPNPSLFIGLHFFNPVHRLPLVEIIRGECTSDQTVAQAYFFVKKLKKIPVVVKDQPGFLVNRLLIPWLSEALWIGQDGMNIRTIDQVFSKQFGFPMGPFRLMDEVGLDISVKVIQSFQSAGFTLPIPKGLESIASNPQTLGKKTRKGFYHYTEKGQARAVNSEMQTLISSISASHLRIPSKEEALKRGIYRMINEGAMVLEEQIISSHQHIDLALIMGAGFPPFRGGLMKYADTVGLKNIVNDLNQWTDRGWKRFQPCSFLQKRVDCKKPFYS